MLRQPKCDIRRCVHYAGFKDLRSNDPSSRVSVCVAYPQGIPRYIAYGTEKHKRRLFDQVGDVVFEEGQDGG